MIYVILGQTASGKTSLALKLARRLSIPVISADAFQCYKELNIGTAKPDRSELEGIEYYFNDELSPDQEVDVCYFQKRFRPLIEEKVKNNEDIIITGGTFLYIRALLFDYRFPEEEDETVYRDLSLSELQQLLKERDLEVYESIDHENRRRIASALRQIDAGYDPSKLKSSGSKKPLYPCRFFKIRCDVREGNERIDQRVDKMFERGLIDEVRDLISRYPENSHAFQAVGYKEVIAGLKNNLTPDEMREQVKIHTRQYAKRQRTFMRTQFSDVIEGTVEEISQQVCENHLLKERSSILLKPGMLSKIEGCKILIAGLGGVGSSCFNSLIRVGYADLTIIDSDAVEESNINRQVMYDLSDVGQAKVDVCERKGHRLDPLAHISAIEVRISSASDLPEERYDIIVDCVDDVSAKVLLFFKAKRDSSLLISSQGLGFCYDSTKICYGKLRQATDPLSRKFRESLRAADVKDGEIDDIDVVYASAGKIKGKRGSKLIGSLATTPAAGGSAITSLILKRLYEEVDR